MVTKAGTDFEDALDTIYRHADGAATIAETLGHVGELLGAERVTFINLDHDGGVRQQTWPFDPEGLLLFARDYAGRDLRLRRLVESGFSGLATTPLVLSREEIARCPVHQEFYRIYPECWEQVNFVMHGLDTLAMPSIHRAATRPPFDVRERDMFAELAPHLAKAIEMERVRRPEERRVDAVAAAFDALPEGMVIFDSDGLVIAMNPAAGRFFVETEPLRLAAGTVTATEPDARAMILDLIAGTLRFQAGDTGRSPAPILVRRPRGGPPLRLSTFGAPARSASGFYAILQIRDMAEMGLPTVGMIRQATGLTPTEARLVHALIGGRKLIEIARDEEASEHTLRTHMRNIRGKLGVASQADALVAILRLCGC